VAALNKEARMVASSRSAVRSVALGATVALIGTAFVGASAGAQDDLSGKLRVDFLAYDAGMQPFLDQVKADFNALHPNVELTLEIPNLDTYRDSLTTQASGGAPPDVAQIATSWLPPLADAGVLADWEEIGYSPDLLGQMDPALRDGARYQGKLFGLPYGASARAVFYNTDLFEQAGIAAPPTTWDELIDAARKLKEAGVEIPFYYEGKGQEAMAAWFAYTYFTNGGELAADGKLTLDQEACVKALTVWDTMNKEGLFESDVTAGTFDQQVATMASGQAAMTISGPWLIGMIKDKGPDTNFGTFPVPQGSNAATVGVTDVYAIFKDSQNPEAAKAFVEFLMDPARNLGFVQGRGFLPIYTEHFALEDFQTEPIKAFVDALPSAKFVPLDKNWVEFDKIGTNAITTMFLDGTGPEAACQAMVDGLAGLEQ
jgi:multiple sugar transport system substrate-binding protein